VVYWKVGKNQIICVIISKVCSGSQMF